MKNVVEVIKLWKKYQSTSFVLNNINLFVPEGTIVGVIGENKSGKSTLINVIMGQLSYDSGLVKICGQVVDGRPLEALNDIGFVSNECRFHGCLSCYEIGNNNITNSVIAGRSIVRFLVIIDLVLVELASYVLALKFRDGS